MGLTGIDDINGCGCGCEDCLDTIATPIELVRKIKGTRRVIIYYDQDLFCEPILISPSLLIGDDKTPWDEHYNICHDEEIGTNGIYDANLEDITLAIYPKPQETKIEGDKRMDVGSTRTYKIGNKIPYDIGNNFTYDWFLTGDAVFENNTQSNMNAGKNVNIIFNGSNSVNISVKITNQCGCSRIINRDVYPGTATKNILVVRYPYFNK